MYSRIENFWLSCDSCGVELSQVWVTPGSPKENGTEDDGTDGFCGDGTNEFCGDGFNEFCGDGFNEFCGDGYVQFCGDGFNEFCGDEEVQFCGDGEVQFCGDGYVHRYSMSRVNTVSDTETSARATQFPVPHKPKAIADSTRASAKMTAVVPTDSLSLVE